MSAAWLRSQYHHFQVSKSTGLLVGPKLKIELDRAMILCQELANVATAWPEHIVVPNARKHEVGLLPCSLTAELPVRLFGKFTERLSFPVWSLHENQE